MLILVISPTPQQNTVDMQPENEVSENAEAHIYSRNSNLHQAPASPCNPVPPTPLVREPPRVGERPGGSWLAYSPFAPDDVELLALHFETKKNLFFVTQGLLASGAISPQQLLTADPGIMLNLGALAFLRSLASQWEYNPTSAPLHLPYTFAANCTAPQRDALQALHRQALHYAATYPEGHERLEKAVCEHVLNPAAQTASAAPPTAMQRLARALHPAVLEQAIQARQELATAMRLIWPQLCALATMT